MKKCGLRKAFAGGGDVDRAAAAKAQADEIMRKYGVSGSTPEPAPAPQPVQQAPAPAPKPQGLMDRLRAVATGNVEKRLQGYELGGDLDAAPASAARKVTTKLRRPPQPTAAPTDGNGIRGRSAGVDDDGYIHGPRGVDKVPAQVTETGENILVSDGERIVNQKQNEALKALAAGATGMHLDDYLEHATGEPVGPTMKRGLRGAVSGGEFFDPAEVQARAAQARALDPTPKAMPSATPAAPAAAPKPMMEPLEIPKTAAAQPQGLAARAMQSTKDFGQNVVDKVKSIGGTGATQEAAKTIKPTQYGGTGIGQIGGAAAGVAKAVAPAAKMAGRGLALASAANQGWDTGSQLRDVWSNDATDLPTKIAGTLEGAGNVAGNALTLGMVHNPVTSLVGMFTDNDTALTRALAGTGNKLSPEELKKPAVTPTPTPTAPTPQGITAQTANPNKDPRQIAWENKAAAYRAMPADQRAAVDMGADAGTLQTQDGIVTGRSRNGQLVVSSGLGRSAAESEELRAKEADRMTKQTAKDADLAERMKIARQTFGTTPEREEAATLLGLRKQAAEDRRADAQLTSAERIAQGNNATARRGQDVALVGHELEAGAKAATLSAARAKQAREVFSDRLDKTIGKADDKDPAVAQRRREIERDMFDAFAEVGTDPSQVPPKELSLYMKLWDRAKEAEPSAPGKIFRKWVLGQEWVKDPNTFRQFMPQSEIDALGYYKNGNGAAVRASDVTGGGVLEGGQDVQIRNEVLARAEEAKRRSLREQAQ